MPLLDRNAEIESGLRNKPVLVPGGSSGIGLAMAQQVVAQGAEVFIASSNAQRVQQAVTCVGGSTVGHTLDLTDEEAVQMLFRKLGNNCSWC